MHFPLSATIPTKWVFDLSRYAARLETIVQSAAFDKRKIRRGNRRKRLTVTGVVPVSDQRSNVAGTLPPLQTAEPEFAPEVSCWPVPQSISLHADRFNPVNSDDLKASLRFISKDFTDLCHVRNPVGSEIGQQRRCHITPDTKNEAPRSLRIEHEVRSLQ